MRCRAKFYLNLSCRKGDHASLLAQVCSRKCARASLFARARKVLRASALWKRSLKLALRNRSARLALRASCSARVLCATALRRLLCTSCSALALCASCAAQVALRKRPTQVDCKCSTQVALRKLLCASSLWKCSLKAALRKRSVVSVLAQLCSREVAPASVLVPRLLVQVFFAMLMRDCSNKRARASLLAKTFGKNLSGFSFWGLVSRYV